jgi:hypothetical protein
MWIKTLKYYFLPSIAKKQTKKIPKTQCSLKMWGNGNSHKMLLKGYAEQPCQRQFDSLYHGVHLPDRILKLSANGW